MDIKLIRLTSGEEVIAEIVEERTSSIKLPNWIANCHASSTWFFARSSLQLDIMNSLLSEKSPDINDGIDSTPANLASSFPEKSLLFKR